MCIRDRYMIYMFLQTRGTMSSFPSDIVLHRHDAAPLRGICAPGFLRRTQKPICAVVQCPLCRHCTTSHPSSPVIHCRGSRYLSQTGSSASNPHWISPINCCYNHRVRNNRPHFLVRTTKRRESIMKKQTIYFAGLSAAAIMAPVSYTHLDVYKRQVIIRTLIP